MKTSAIRSSFSIFAIAAALSAGGLCLAAETPSPREVSDAVISDVKSGQGGISGDGVIQKIGDLWVIKHNGIVYHFYCAVGNRGRGIGLATSKPLK